MELKSEIIGLRMTPKMKKELGDMCGDLGTDPQELIRSLIIKELQQWKKRPGRPRLETTESERR